MKCKHQFFEIGKMIIRNPDISKYTHIYVPDIKDDGIMIMCALCGERRHLHADGRLEVLEGKDE